MEHKILLVEDDMEISKILENHLKKDGYTITIALDGEDGLHKFLENSFDLVILDLMMPKLNGLELMKIIREKSTVPIIIMSAKDTDVDKALGLGFGADDYISKPFSLIEISARIESILRRVNKYSNNENSYKNNIVTIKDITIDFNNFTVSKNGEYLNLTSKEFEILKLFARNQNRVFTKAQIYNAVWNDNYYGDENVINVHMRRLREKIEDNPSQPQYIRTLWGIGYKLGDL